MDLTRQPSPTLRAVEDVVAYLVEQATVIKELAGQMQAALEPIAEAVQGTELAVYIDVIADNAGDLKSDAGSCLYDLQDQRKKTAGSTDGELAIWWTGQHDCQEIGEPHWRADLSPLSSTPPMIEGTRCLLDDMPWPYYVKREYQNRYGRSGRCQLWVNSLPLCRRLLADDAAGIVLYRDHLPMLAGTPGIITGLDMARLSMGIVNPRFQAQQNVVHAEKESNP
jgi:hypothetical protein